MVRLIHGRRYQATITLTGFQTWASNDQVAEKFSELGFRHVVVTGDGDERVATGVWGQKDQDVDISDQPISNVQEI